MVLRGLACTFGAYRYAVYLHAALLGGGALDAALLLFAQGEASVAPYESAHMCVCPGGWSNVMSVQCGHVCGVWMGM